MPARRSQQRCADQRGPPAIQVTPQEKEGQHCQHASQRGHNAHLHHADAQELEAQRDQIGEQCRLAFVGLGVGQVARAFQPAKRIQPIVALVRLAAVGERVKQVEAHRSRHEDDCQEEQDVPVLGKQCSVISDR